MADYSKPVPVHCLKDGEYFNGTLYDNEIIRIDTGEVVHEEDCSAIVFLPYIDDDDDDCDDF